MGTIGYIEIDNLPGEVWLPLVAFGHTCEVSNKGRVKNTRTGKLRVCRLRGGNISFGVHARVSQGKPKYTQVAVHRAVAITFIPNPNNLPYVVHKDRNLYNNDKDNLMWTDKKYGGKHAGKVPVILTDKENKEFSFPSISKAALFLDVKVEKIRRVLAGEHKEVKSWKVRKNN